MLYRLRHSLASVREVVWPAIVNSGPYVLTLLGVGALAWFIWGRQDTVDPEAIAARTVASQVEPFEGAQTLADSGDLDAARTHMLALAPIGGGDVRAHWWMARDLLTQVGETEEKEVAKVLMDQAQAHLREVVARDKENLEALPLLAQAYVLDGKLRQAFLLVDANALRLPSLHLLAADLAGGLGDMRSRERHAISAAAHFERLAENVEVPESERSEAQRSWAKAEIMLQNFEDAREVLRDGRTLFADASEDDGGEWKSLLLQTWMGPIRQQLARNESEAVMRQLLEAAEEVGPNRELVESAGSLVARAEGALREELEGFYERMVETSESTLDMQVALGSMALALARPEDGLTHLERAVEEAPNHVIALNNLGYGLVFLAEPPQLEKGLELLDRAVAAGQKTGKIPPNVWETRGQILGKLGRWKEAVIDLERALRNLPGHVEIHRTLAQAYGQLDQQMLAEQHRRLAEQHSQS